MNGENYHLFADKMSFSEIYHTLNSEQREAFQLLQSGKNVFITGNAGTGKSYLIKAFDKYCSENDIKLIKSAPTGIASVEIGGATLHSLFKLKVGLDFSSPTKAPEVLEGTDVLLIDEISMVRIDIFDKIMKCLELANKNRSKPIQLVLVGDFFQLAPVINKEEKPFLNEHYGVDVMDGYCFQSRYWRKNHIILFNLKTVIRQENTDFCSALDKCKKGDTTCLAYFRKSFAASEIPGAIWVCGNNRTVTQRNEEGLSKLDGLNYKVEAEYSGAVTKTDKLCDEIFCFKIGARVVMLANDTDCGRYQNGSLGTVLRVNQDKIVVEIDGGEVVEVSRKSIPKYEYKYVSKKGRKALERNKVGEARQYPMRLGYAVTVHKSQGQTYEKMNFEPQIFSNGQLYVALSRCKSAEGIYANGYISNRMVMSSSEVNRYYADPENYTFFNDNPDQLTFNDIEAETAEPDDTQPQTVPVEVPIKYLPLVMDYLNRLAE